MTPILIDCDDVLLDWCSGFGQYASARTGVPLNGALPNGWDMAPWLGVPAAEIEPLIADFNAGDGGYFAHLPARPDALEVVPRLKAAGHPLYVITSCSGDPSVRAMRKANLRARFGDIFAEVYCLPLGEPKDQSLRLFCPAVWVEDNHTNAIAGAEAGHRTYVMRRTHNRAKEAACQRTDLTWVDTWHDVKPMFGAR